MAQGDVGIFASQISGRLWAPNGAMDALATVTPSGVSTVTFTGIPSGYKHLQIRYIGRSSRAINSSDIGDMRFNEDTAGNYTRFHGLYGNGSGTGAQSGGFSATSILGVTYAGNSTAAGLVACGIIDILDYGSTSKNKVVRHFDGFDSNGSSGQELDLWSGNWMNSTTAINSITFYLPVGNFDALTNISLYGVK